MAKPEIQFVGPVVDRRPKPPRNGYSKWGFLVTLFSCGALAPLGLLLSMLGLFGRPKTLAVFGTLVNGAICTFVFLPASVHFAEHAHRQHRRHEQARHQRDEVDRGAVSKTIAQANERISEYLVANGGALPEGVTGNKLIFGLNDQWEQPLRYEVSLDLAATKYTIRSAGRDRKWETRDDIQVDYSTVTSRNDAATPTATPAATSGEGSTLNEIPLSESLKRVEVRSHDGRTYIVVVNR